MPIPARITAAATTTRSTNITRLNADGRDLRQHVSGTVVVNAWDKNEVQVNGSLGYGVDHLEVTGDAASLSVAVKLPKHSHNSGESDLRLMVPARRSRRNWKRSA